MLPHHVVLTYPRYLAWRQTESLLAYPIAGDTSVPLTKAV